MAATAVILRALLRGAGVPQPEGAADLAIFRAQLGEVERDLARGTIAQAEAEAARLEIKRRILDLDRRTQTAHAPLAEGPTGLPLAALFVSVLGAIGLYGWLGAPFYPDIPHADRIAAAEQIKSQRPSQKAAEASAESQRPAPRAPDAAFAALMAQLRDAVAKRPSDIKGLALLAENERKLGNLAASARAQAQLVGALGDQASAMDYAALADILVSAAGGQVTADADLAIVETLKRDPANGTARFYAGLSQAQIGRPDLAFTIWNALLQDSPPDAPWVPYLSAQMPDLAAAAGAPYQPPALKGPTAEDVASAQSLTKGDRAQMIAGMVDGLERRLMTEGGSAAEWAQLVRALGVLGDQKRASAAWARAQTALADDPAGLASVALEAKSAGLAP